MQGRSERHTASLSLASAITSAVRYPILPSRNRESSGKSCDLIASPLSDRSKAGSDRSVPPVCESR